MFTETTKRTESILGMEHTKELRFFGILIYREVVIYA